MEGDRAFAGLAVIVAKGLLGQVEAYGPEECSQAKKGESPTGCYPLSDSELAWNWLEKREPELLA